jgi:DNA-binding NarL/FixJ family response regulator
VDAGGRQRRADHADRHAHRKRCDRQDDAGGQPRSLEVLVLTTFDADEQVLKALRAGAGGFVVKDTPPEETAARSARAGPKRAPAPRARVPRT